MDSINYQLGDLVEHVHFGTELFVVKVDNGKIGCRYRSFHRNKDANSEFILHYVELEKFEVKLRVRAKQEHTDIIIV